MSLVHEELELFREVVHSLVARDGLGEVAQALHASQQELTRFLDGEDTLLASTLALVAGLYARTRVA